MTVSSFPLIQSEYSICGVSIAGIGVFFSQPIALLVEHGGNDSMAIGSIPRERAYLEFTVSGFK